MHSGADGIVYYLEAGRGQGGGGGFGGGGSELLRYRLCDRRATTFVAGVAAFEVSADGRKLVYRLLGWNPYQPIFFRLVDALRC